MKQTYFLYKLDNQVLVVYWTAVQIHAMQGDKENGISMHLLFTALFMIYYYSLYYFIITIILNFVDVGE